GVVAPTSENKSDLHHLYVVRSSDRDSLKSHLDANKIETKIHWAQPLHQMHASWADGAGSFLQAQAWSDSILSLPCYPGLTEEEIATVCDAIEEFFASRKAS